MMNNKIAIQIAASVLDIGGQAYGLMIENLKSDDYCPKKELFIKAAAFDLINDAIKEITDKEKNND